MTEGAFVPIEKVANHFCVTVHTIRAWVRQGHIPRNAYVKVGNTYRFSVSRITEALTGGNMKDPTPETVAVEPNLEDENVQEPVQLELNFDADEDV